jgi:hypothetical protein
VCRLLLVVPRRLEGLYTAATIVSRLTVTRRFFEIIEA